MKTSRLYPGLIDRHLPPAYGAYRLSLNVPGNPQQELFRVDCDETV